MRRCASRWSTAMSARRRSRSRMRTTSGTVRSSSRTARWLALRPLFHCSTSNTVTTLEPGKSFEAELALNPKSQTYKHEFVKIPVERTEQKTTARPWPLSRDRRPGVRGRREEPAWLGRQDHLQAGRVRGRRRARGRQVTGRIESRHASFCMPVPPKDNGALHLAVGLG